MAVVIVPFGISAAVAVGSIAVTLAAWVLLAHWGSPKAKRVITAALLVATVAAVVAITVHAEDDFLMQDPCKKYTSADWQWWANGCFWP